jgi:hypothetical protein
VATSCDRCGEEMDRTNGMANRMAVGVFNKTVEYPTHQFSNLASAVPPAGPVTRYNPTSAMVECDLCSRCAETVAGKLKELVGPMPRAG